MSVLVKKRRTKKKLNYDYPVVVVARSNKNVVAQVLEAKTKKTLFTSTSQGMKKVSKIDKSIKVGEEIAKYLTTNKIKKVVFDRNGLLFHGRVKQVADTIKENKILI